jgi:hypothetical protein
MELKLLNIQRGIAAVLAGGKTIPFRGQATGDTVLGPMIAAALAPYVNVTNLRSSLRVGVEARNSNDATVKQLVHDVQIAVETAFGQGTEFEQFGFKPRKQAQALTPEQKQLKVEKLRQTRAQRHTMGKRQKAAIKGGVVNPPASDTTNAAPTNGTQGNGGGSVAK